jgi:hypothetical protein
MLLLIDTSLSVMSVGMWELIRQVGDRMTVLLE